jgi:hypothetical protein
MMRGLTQGGFAASATPLIDRYFGKADTELPFPGLPVCISLREFSKTATPFLLGAILMTHS